MATLFHDVLAMLQAFETTEEPVSFAQAAEVGTLARAVCSSLPSKHERAVLREAWLRWACSEATATSPTPDSSNLNSSISGLESHMGRRSATISGPEANARRRHRRACELAWERLFRPACSFDDSVNNANPNSERLVFYASVPTASATTGPSPPLHVPLAFCCVDSRGSGLPVACTRQETKAATIAALIQASS